ncbi:unnamed protein product, partial [Brachionus calyciflorus]
MKTSKRVIDVDMVGLESHFKNIFTERNQKDNPNAEETKKNIDNFKEKYFNNIFNFEIKEKEIENAITSLRNGKSVGFGCVSNEMVKYTCSNDLVVILKTVFEKMINFQVVPYLFNISVLKPLVKCSKKSNKDINNLRPVSISDVITNLYEKILLNNIEKQHIDHRKQFGFKKDSSCSHAVFILKQAIKVSKSEGKNLYVCAIDASKAFDKVNREILWNKLIKKNINPAIDIALMEYYKYFLMLVQNENEYSNIFETKTGVKQGGAASPRLFSVYIEGLIERVEKLKVGIFIGGVKVDIIVYADDVLLISTSLSGLQKQLDVVHKYGIDNEIKYNPEKTVYLRFGTTENKTRVTLKLGETPICEVSETKYLGIEISNVNENKVHLDKRKQLALQAYYKLKRLGLLNEQIHSNLKSQLYKIYIRPVLFYGIECIYLTKMEKLSIKRFEGNI